MQTLEQLFNPRSIALFGSSDHIGSLSALVWKNLTLSGFKGSVFQVNPKSRLIGGVLYDPIKDIPFGVDLAVICTPAKAIAKILIQLSIVAATQKGKPTTILLMSPDASERQLTEIRALVSKSPLLVIGPDSRGLIIPKLSLNISPLTSRFVPGDIALVSLFGPLEGALLDWAHFKKIRISQYISLGASCAIDISDLLDTLGTDSSVRAVVVYMETIPRSKRFISAARAAARNKPVIFFHRSNKMRSHGESLGSTVVCPTVNEVLTAALTRAGVLCANSLEALFSVSDSIGADRDVGSTGLTEYRRLQSILGSYVPRNHDEKLFDLREMKQFFQDAAADGQTALGQERVLDVLTKFGAEPWVGDVPNEIQEESKQAVALESANIIIGSIVDPCFGPLVFLRSEASNPAQLGPCAVGFPPLNEPLALEMVRYAQLIFTDSAPLLKLIIAMSLLVQNIPEIDRAEIHLSVSASENPKAKSAGIQITPKANRKINFAFSPYPNEWIENQVWCGEAITLRPICSEDELQHRQFLEKLSPRDVRMRIFFTKREIAHNELIRLTQIDYRREMAFIAERVSAKLTELDPSEMETLAVVRVVRIAAESTAEFAIVVRSDLQNRGLGLLMLKKATLYARQIGIKKLIGTVLRENLGMLHLARNVGFVNDPKSVEDDEVVDILLNL